LLDDKPNPDRSEGERNDSVDKTISRCLEKLFFAREKPFKKVIEAAYGEKNCKRQHNPKVDESRVI